MTRQSWLRNESRLDTRHHHYSNVENDYGNATAPVVASHKYPLVDAAIQYLEVQASTKDSACTKDEKRDVYFATPAQCSTRSLSMNRA